MMTMFLVLVAAASLSWALMEYTRRKDIEEERRKDERIRKFVMDMVDEERTGWRR